MNGKAKIWERKTYRGTLDTKDLYNINYVHPDSDVALTVNKPGFKCEYVVAMLAYVGVQIRCSGFNVKTLVVWYCFSDDVAIRTGDVFIGELLVMDVHAYIYSNKNHKDVVQVYNYDSTTNKLIDEPVKNFTLNKLTANMGGENKHIFHCTETCGYEDFNLFADGVEIVDYTAWKNSYLISSTNAVRWTIGSPEHPIDPRLIGDRAIRIDGRKPGSKPSEDLTIHARPGLKLELDDSAQAALNLIEYPYD